MFVYVNTSTSVSVVPEIERFVYLSTPVPDYVIHVEGEDLLCDYSYFCVYYLYEREVCLFEHSYLCV